MAFTEVVKAEQLFDSAIGSIKVKQSTVIGFDIDDYVTTTVQSIATTIQMYNKATLANLNFTQNRRIVSVGGVSVGGYNG